MKRKIYKVGDKTTTGWDVVKKEIVYSYTLRRKVRMVSGRFEQFRGKEYYLYYDQTLGIQWVEIEGKMHKANPSDYQYI